MNKLSGIVETLNYQGLGVVKCKGENYYIPYVLPGEEIEFSEKFRCSKFIRGELVQILTNAPGRTDPVCPHFTSCGGCSLQHMSEASYRQFKSSLLASAVAPGIVPEFHFLSPGKRRRASFHLQKTAALSADIGFFAFESKKIIPLTQCNLLSDGIFAAFAKAKEKIIANLVLIKDKEIDFSITELKNGYEIIFIFQKSYHKEFALLASLFEFSVFGRVVFKVQEQIVLSKEFFTLEIAMSDLVFPYPRGAFLQGNLQAEQLLSQQVKNFAEGKQKIIDLYCGLGPYSLAASQDGNCRVKAYEGNQEMVESLHNIAQKIGLAINSFCRDLHKEPVTDWADIDGAIINPPRNGAERQIRAIMAAKVPEVLMISCSIMELKRDLKILQDVGYKITSMQIIDQFPWSSHLESCTKLVL